jgi:hypothetical protein
MASTATQLVGRAVELALLDRLLDRVRGGEPAACAVSGDAGIGKTRLLAELAARADAQGCLVLTGSGSEFERDVPFGLVVGALEDYVAGLDPERLETLDGGARARLAPLLPALGRADAEAGTAHDRHRTHQAFRELLRVLAEETPVVLALDDVHWADSGSAETDNAWTYIHNRGLRELLAERAIEHRRIPPRTPKRNGKIERYQQTLAREWAYGQRYRSSTARAAALPIWLNHYDTNRNRSSLSNRPPISRVRNDPRQNS